jgi:hypothetical protein
MNRFRLGGAAGWALRGLGVLALAVGLARAALQVYFAVEVPPIAASTETGPPLSPRALLIVIDGLRFDTALESGWMPRLAGLARSGAAGVALTPQVTMTSTGVRALGSGVSPGMADLVRYGALPPVSWDSLAAQVVQHGGRVALVGDAAWREAFGPFIAVDESESGFAGVFHSINNVYGADAVWVPRAVEMAKRRDWQLAIVMLGGVDHASHRWTPHAPPFRDKIEMTDRDIARIVAAAGDDVTVIVTSDHGTGDRGHHGSGEPDARRTPLVLAGRGIAPGTHLDARQIDVAATVATLLGLPIPAASEGRVLTESLAVSTSDRASITDRNLRQLTRLADAYGTLFQLAPPRIPPDDPHALCDWLERVRARASVGPILWALALVFVAIGLVISDGRRGTLAPLWLLAIGACVWALAGDGRGTGAALVALVASALALADAVVDAPRVPVARFAVGAVVVAGAEALFAVWRWNVRLVELWQLAIAERLRQSPELVVALLTIALAIPAALLLRQRRNRLETVGPWATLVVLATLAAAGDDFALPVGVAAGAVACFAWAPRRDLPSLLAALAAGGFGIAWVSHPSLVRFDLTRGAPLLLALIGIAVLPSRRRLVIAALLGIALCALAVRWMGSPPLAVGAFLVAATVLLVAGARGDCSAELLGFGAAELLAFLSRSEQVPGIVAWTVFALSAGRLWTTRPAQPPLLVATLACIATRLGLFAVLEGAFRFSNIEVQVGYAANPGTEHLLGGALVCFKFLLPYLIALALGTARLARRERALVVVACAVFHLFRVGHVVLSMTITRGTFYSPYLDAGHLLFQLAMLGSLVIVGAAVGLRSAGVQNDVARAS